MCRYINAQTTDSEIFATSKRFWAAVMQTRNMSRCIISLYLSLSCIECLGVNNDFPSATSAQLWLFIAPILSSLNLIGFITTASFYLERPPPHSQFYFALAFSFCSPVLNTIGDSWLSWKCQDAVDANLYYGRLDEVTGWSAGIFEIASVYTQTPRLNVFSNHDKHKRKRKSTHTYSLWEGNSAGNCLR